MKKQKVVVKAYEKANKMFEFEMPHNTSVKDALMKARKLNHAVSMILIAKK